MHPSFAQPTRELNKPPFEVTETGWGEFEASIRIVWNDVAEERSTIVSVFSLQVVSLLSQSTDEFQLFSTHLQTSCHLFCYLC